MEWSDEGIVLGVRRHGETNAIVELLTQAHGRHLGLVRGGGGTRLRAVLQPGNTLRATWRARLDEHLGFYAVDGIRSARRDRAGVVACGPRRHPSGGAVRGCCRSASRTKTSTRCWRRSSRISTTSAPPRSEIARFELALLAELGFGLDLTSCAATGVTEDLIYVSPKSGRAVSRLAGEPWRDKLLRLPAFLRGDGARRAGRTAICATAST